VDFHALLGFFAMLTFNGSTGTMQAGSSSWPPSGEGGAPATDGLLDGSCRQGLVPYAVPQKPARHLRRSAALQMMLPGGRHEE
jgi:hypothetical protein